MVRVHRLTARVRRRRSGKGGGPHCSGGGGHNRGGGGGSVHGGQNCGGGGGHNRGGGGGGGGRGRGGHNSGRSVHNSGRKGYSRGGGGAPPPPLPPLPPPPLMNSRYEVKYAYDSATGFGSIPQWRDMVIFVDTCEPNKSRARSIGLFHENLLPTVATHPYGNRENTIYHGYAETLRDHVIHFRNTKQALVITDTIPYDPKIQNVTEIRYKYVPDVYRHFLNGAIKCIICLHDNDLALSDLNLDNFVIVDGRLALRRLNYGPNSWKNMANDFKFLADVIVDLFEDWDMPPDIQHLCFCLRQCNYRLLSSEHRFFSNHLAVLETDDRLNMIKAFKDRSSLVSKSNYYCIIQGMWFEDWTRWFAGNDPAWGPVLDSYTRKDEGSNKCMYQIEDTNNRIAMNGTTIRFSRNMATHLLDNFGEYVTPKSLQHVDRIIMATFGNQLLSFQATARRYNSLRPFLPSSR